MNSSYTFFVNFTFFFYFKIFDQNKIIFIDTYYLMKINFWTIMFICFIAQSGCIFCDF